MYTYGFIHIVTTGISFILGACIRFTFELFHPNIIHDYFYSVLIFGLIMGQISHRIIQNYFIEQNYREWINIQRWIPITEVFRTGERTAQDLDKMHINYLKKKCIKNLDECRIK